MLSGEHKNNLMMLVLTSLLTENFGGHYTLMLGLSIPVVLYFKQCPTTTVLLPCMLNWKRNVHMNNAFGKSSSVPFLNNRRIGIHGNCSIQETCIVDRGQAGAAVQQNTILASLQGQLS